MPLRINAINDFGVHTDSGVRFLEWFNLPKPQHPHL